MKLEVGKYYKTRDGRKVGPLRHHSQIGKQGWPYEVPQIWVTYRLDGKHLYCGSDSAEDLISEWPAETGTLRELNVQVGDVVEWIDCGSSKHKVLDARVIPDGDYFAGQIDARLSNFGSGIFDKEQFRIVSRAASLPIDGPVQMRPVIVPGVYGDVAVHDGYITVETSIDRKALLEAIATLQSIADALGA